jgi:hypothetical protein
LCTAIFNFPANVFGKNVMISKRVYVAWFGIHFFLITAVCFAGLFSLVAERATILPSALKKRLVGRVQPLAIADTATV